MATSLINGYAIKVTHFAVGNQGHLTETPLSARTPDPGLNPTPGVTGDALAEDTVFGPKLITSATVGSSALPLWTATLEKGEATGEVSSYYLLAKWVYPDPGADTTHDLYGLYDKLWVWSYAYTPLKIKTDNDAFVATLGIQF